MRRDGSTTRLLPRRFLCGDRGAAAEFIIAKRRLPVPGDGQLRAIQELRAIEESPGEIGAVEHRLEQVRFLQVRAGELRVGKVGSPQIGTPQIGTRKIKPAQIEAA